MKCSLQSRKLGLVVLIGVTTFRPVVLSSSTRARWAIPPLVFAAFLLAGKPTAAAVSAI
jgi:hypothetical protein